MEHRIKIRLYIIAAAIIFILAFFVLFSSGCGPAGGDDGRQDFIIVPAPPSFPRTWISPFGTSLPQGEIFKFNIFNASSYAIDIGWNQQAGGDIVILPGGMVYLTTTVMPDVCQCDGLIYQAGQQLQRHWTLRTYRAGTGYLTNSIRCDCVFDNNP